MAIDDVCSEAYASLIDGMYDYCERCGIEDFVSTLEAILSLARVIVNCTTPFDLTEQEIRKHVCLAVLYRLCHESRSNDDFESILPMLRKAAHKSTPFREVLDEYKNYQKTEQGLIDAISRSDLAYRINKISR